MCVSFCVRLLSDLIFLLVVVQMGAPTPASVARLAPVVLVCVRFQDRFGSEPDPSRFLFFFCFLLAGSPSWV